MKRRIGIFLAAMLFVFALWVGILYVHGDDLWTVK